MNRKKQDLYLCEVTSLPYFDEIGNRGPKWTTEEIFVPLEASKGLGNTVRRFFCGICGFFGVDVDAEFLDEALGMGFNVMMAGLLDEDFGRAGDIEKRAQAAGLTPSEYVDQKLDLAIDYMGRHGEKVWFEVIGEHDCRWWPNRNFSTRQAAYQWFEKFIKHTTEVKEDLPAVAETLPRFCRYPTIFELLERRGLAVKDLNLYAGPGQEFDIHYLHQWGFRLVCLERNVGLGNVQVGISFLRGSATQHDAYWGVYFACWLPNEALSCPAYDRDLRPLGGNTESYTLRAWLATYLSGANVVAQDNSDTTHFVRLEDGRFVLSPMGEAGKQFYEFSVVRHPNRGIPHAPIALMLEQYHGWHYNWGFHHGPVVWGNRVPYEPGDRMIENFFQAAFPGYLEAGRSYARPWSEVPWNNRQECAQMRQEGLDISQFEKGDLVPSRWGDIFDVVLENCSLEVLQNYPVVFLLGRIRMSPELLEKLTAYVANGGIVVANSGNLSREMNDFWFRGSPLRMSDGEKEFFGMEKGGGCSNYLDDFHCDLCGWTNHELKHGHTRVELAQAEGIAHLDQDEAAVTCRRLGKGRIYFFTQLYLQDAYNTGVLESCLHMLDHIFGEQQLATVEPFGLQYLVNRIDDGILVSLFNHNAEAWTGQVRTRNFDPASTEVKEWWKDETSTGRIEGSDLILDCVVPPHGFKFYACRGEVKLPGAGSVVSDRASS